MNLNDVHFIINLSTSVNYRIVTALKNLKCEYLEIELKNTVRFHAIYRFKINMIHVDIQFKALKDINFIGLNVNVVGREEHIHKIERWNRLIKE